MFLDDALLVPTQVCLVVAAFNSGQFEFNSQVFRSLTSATFNASALTAVWPSFQGGKFQSKAQNHGVFLLSFPFYYASFRFIILSVLVKSLNVHTTNAYFA